VRSINKALITNIQLLTHWSLMRTAVSAL